MEHTLSRGGSSLGRIPRAGQYPGLTAAEIAAPREPRAIPTHTFVDTVFRRPPPPQKASPRHSFSSSRRPRSRKNANTRRRASRDFSTRAIYFRHARSIVDARIRCRPQTTPPAPDGGWAFEFPDVHSARPRLENVPVNLTIRNSRVFTHRRRVRARGRRGLRPAQEGGRPGRGDRVLELGGSAPLGGD